MRHIENGGRAILLLLSVGLALSACTATASTEAGPYTASAYYDANPPYPYLGDTPFDDDFGFVGVWGDRHHDHHDGHHGPGHVGHDHVAFHDGGHGFGHVGVGGGHGGGAHGR